MLILSFHFVIQYLYFHQKEDEKLILPWNGTRWFYHIVILKLLMDSIWMRQAKRKAHTCVISTTSLFKLLHNLKKKCLAWNLPAYWNITRSPLPLTACLLAMWVTLTEKSPILSLKQVMTGSSMLPAEQRQLSAEAVLGYLLSRGGCHRLRGESLDWWWSTRGLPLPLGGFGSSFPSGLFPDSSKAKS